MITITGNPYLQDRRVELTIHELVKNGETWVKPYGAKNKNISIVVDKDFDTDDENQQEELKAIVISELKKMGYNEIRQDGAKWGID